MEIFLKKAEYPRSLEHRSTKTELRWLNTVFRVVSGNLRVGGVLD